MERLKNLLIRYKKPICMALIALVLLVFVGFEAKNVLDAGHKKLALLLLAGGTVGVALLCVLFHFIVKNKGSLEKLFLCVMIPLLLVYTFAFPPFTVPDETTHAASAYKISNYILFRSEQFGKSETFVRQADAAFFAEENNTRVSIDRYAKILRYGGLFTGDTALTETEEETAVENAPFGYIVAGAALALGRILHLDTVPLLFFGRLANAAVFLLAVFWAIKKTPVGKLAFMAICALPMTLHVAASFSYDGMILAFVLLFMAEFLSLLYGEQPATRADKIRLFAFGVLVATSKMIYLPLLLLVFLIPKEKLGFSKGKSLLFKCGAVALGAAVILLLQFSEVFSTVSSEHVSETLETECYTLAYFFSNLKTTGMIFVRSIYQYGDFYLASLIGYCLGWFQIDIPLILYLPFILILFASFVKREGENVQTRFGQKLWILLLTLGSVFLAMLSMFLFWTPIGTPVIEGVQGRYFLPLLPCVFLLARNKFLTRSVLSDRYLLFLIPTFQILAVTAFAASAMMA